jgi:hypothetical protein
MVTGREELSAKRRNSDTFAPLYVITSEPEDLQVKYFDYAMYVSVYSITFVRNIFLLR